MKSRNGPRQARYGLERANLKGLDEIVLHAEIVAALMLERKRHQEVLVYQNNSLRIFFWLRSFAPHREQNGAVTGFVIR